MTKCTARCLHRRQPYYVPASLSLCDISNACLVFFCNLHRNKERGSGQEASDCIPLRRRISPARPAKVFCTAEDAEHGNDAHQKHENGAERRPDRKSRRLIITKLLKKHRPIMTPANRTSGNACHTPRARIS